MKPWLFFALAAVLIGCATPKPAVEVKPEAAPNPTVNPSKPVDLVKDGNPSRVYQLDTLQRVTLDVKGHSVQAWVMDTEEKRAEGMMFLTDKEVPDDAGMLFAFEAVQPKSDERGFWMKNTILPLDIVYMSSKGQVQNIGNGKPHSESVIPAEGDFQYVLELKAGTAAKYGLKPGDSIKIPKL